MVETSPECLLMCAHRLDQLLNSMYPLEVPETFLADPSAITS
jgi:hypothetical protein